MGADRSTLMDRGVVEVVSSLHDLEQRPRKVGRHTASEYMVVLRTPQLCADVRRHTRDPYRQAEMDVRRSLVRVDGQKVEDVAQLLSSLVDAVHHMVLLLVCQSFIGTFVVAMQQHLGTNVVLSEPRLPSIRSLTLDIRTNGRGQFVTCHISKDLDVRCASTLRVDSRLEFAIMTTLRTTVAEITSSETVPEVGEWVCLSP